MEIIPLNNFLLTEKLACFDYDHTLVCPILNGRFPKDEDDWRWLYPSVPDTLIDYHRQRFSIIIFTNQSKTWKRKQILNAITTLNIPVCICIAFDKAYYKPSNALWTKMLTDVDREPDFKRMDMSHSFFVGDALGRKGDFADSDKGFAINCGIVYYSPEEFFNTQVSIDIESIAKKIPLTIHKEAIIMVGYPGSGKSTIAHNILENQRGYVVLSGDKFKTPVRLNREARKYLLDGKSVVYDATNPSEERRNKYIELLNEMDIPYRIIWVDTDMPEAMRRARLREEKTDIHIPNIAFYVYRKSLEPPVGDNVIIIDK